MIGVARSVVLASTPLTAPSPQSPMIFSRQLLCSLLCVGALIAGATGSAFAKTPRFPTREEVRLDKSLYAKERRIEQLIVSAHLALQDQKRVEADFAVEQALSIDPTRIRTHYEAGILYRHESGQKAKHHLERYLSMEHDRGLHSWADAHTVLGEIEYEAYRSEPAIPEYVKHHLELAERHFLAAHEALYQHGNRGKLAVLEGRLFNVARARKDHAAALRYLYDQRAHNPLKPKPAESLHYEVRVLIDLKRPDEALTIAESLSSEGIVDGQGRLNLEALDNTFLIVECYRALGEYDLALQILGWLETTFTPEVEPGQPPPQPHPVLEYIFEKKANVHFSAGDYDKARDYQQRLYDLKPGDAMRMNNLAWTLTIASPADPDVLQKALRLSERAVLMQPNAAHLDTIAEIYLRLGRYHDALDAMNRALRLYPNDRYLLQQRSRILEAQGGFIAPGEGPTLRFERWAPPEGDVVL